MEERICKNCKWYEYIVDIGDFGDGNCHRYPKQSSNKQEETGCVCELYQYPTVHGKHDWCGEWIGNSQGTYSNG